MELNNIHKHIINMEIDTIHRRQHACFTFITDKYTPTKNRYIYFFLIIINMWLQQQFNETEIKTNFFLNEIVLHVSVQVVIIPLLVYTYIQIF